MSYLYRCKKPCYKRHHFKKNVEEYAKTKICPSCKGEIVYMDKWQMKKNKLDTCNCDGISHPHRAGSTVWCKEHKTGPSEQDYEDRYGK